MKRRAFLRALGTAALIPILPSGLLAAANYRRCRPSDLAWPAQSEWKRLDEALGGNLIPVDFPFSKSARDTATDNRLWTDLKNPYYIGEQPGLTQTLGWVDAWATKPSIYAVAARNANDIAAAVDFARQHKLRLAIKGGGHSYQGTSNAPDSLLIWTRHMNGIEMHSAFVPQGYEGVMRPQPAVTIGAGAIWIQAYEAVTTVAGKYVQGGGCTTVGVAGLVQSGGFGSFSKHYGLAAGSLLEAEVVTADGRIRIANQCNERELFWALKGGGGGTFGVVSKLTLRLHDLPAYFGAANFKIKAASDDAYRRLITKFVNFYHEYLFNDHWGEQAYLGPDNTLVIAMVCQGLDTAEMKRAWKPLLDWVGRSPHAYSFEGRVILAAIPARHFWDLQWWQEHWPELAFPPNGSRLVGLFDDVLTHLHSQPVFRVDQRSGAGPNQVWWAGDASQVGWFIWGYESLWLPSALLGSGGQQHLADALFASSRYAELALHFNKGLAGGSPDAIAAAKDTAINPAVVDAFVLVIAVAGQGPAYPGIPGHTPSLARGREAAIGINSCIARLRALVPEGGSYVAESNYFEKGWQRSYWGRNYPRLAAIKRKYDPDGLFFVHHGIGSEDWSADGFVRL
jgi:FAD/FMN-containing dehydrogenase